MAIKKASIHEINEGRKTYGKYHHLFPKVKEDRDKFKYLSEDHKYLSMSQEMFKYILSKIEHRLQKQWCNLHQQPILPEERLVITLRFVNFTYCIIMLIVLKRNKF